MTTTGIEGVYIETHNWGKTVAFWKALGFELTFETDHHSGQLEHPTGGPFLFVAERPADHEVQTQLIVAVDDVNTFTPDAPVVISKPFEPTHWQRMEGFADDPDGRTVSLQAPIPDGVNAPPGHP